MKMLKTLSNKEKKLLIETYKLNTININKKDLITKKENIYIINNEPTLIEIKTENLNNKNKTTYLLPFLKNIDKNLKYFNKEFSYIKIDKGAIPYILNGADIMRPGITEVSTFNRGEPILIIEENHNKTLAIGIPLFDSTELKQKKAGKVIKNIHFYNDNYFKEKKDK